MQKITKRILAYVLTLAILLSSLVFGAVTSVSAERKALTLEISTDYNLEGSGTEADPYLIKTAQQLAAVVSGNKDGAFTGKHFKLANDIQVNDTSVENWQDYVTENWIWRDFRFIGTFDGDGHTIDGLYFNGAKKRFGLFSYVGANDAGTIQTTIKNFKMTNVYIENSITDNGTAFVAGQASKVASFHNIYIDDTCEIVTSTVTAVGGILGQSAYNVFMSNIAMNGKVTGKANVGAFVGSLTSGAKLDLKSSYTTADLYVQGVTDRNLSTTSTKVYVTKKQGTIDEVAAVINANDIKGEAAKTAMPTLNFKTLFKTVENGYPVPTTSQVWDSAKNLTDHSTFAGAGTKENPYIIENGNQLYYAVVGCGSKANQCVYYKLSKDIVLNDTAAAAWKNSAKAWGVNTAQRFNGTLDGDGHTIEGLFFNVNSTNGRYGLIAYVGNQADAPDPNKITEVKNLVFVGASVTNTTTSSFEGVGIVAGQGSGSASFENIYIDETSEVNAPNVKGVAGIIARSDQKITINNCAVLGTYTGKSHVSSFLGTFWGGSQSISNSYSAANVPVTTSRTPTISNVYATVKTSDNYYDKEVVLVDEENMKGENAKTYMPGLSFKYVWEITDSYPVLNVRGEIWNGSVASSYDDFEGNGTAADPYIIKNGAQLAFAVSENPNLADGSYFKLANDIILNDASYEGWEAEATPWRWKNHARFNGTLDGDGHTIEGLYINTNSTNGRLGLFAYIGKTTAMDKIAEVKNLTFTGASVNSTATGKVEGISIIAGQTSGHTVFENVYIDETCEINAPDTAIGVGSFAGRGYQNEGGVASAYITNCATLATINASTETSNAVGAFTGSYWTDASTVEINNSFTTINRPLSGDKKLTNSANNIGLVSYDSSTRVVEVENMKGLDANLYMEGLNFNQVWKTTNGYPVLTDEAYRADFWDGTSADGFAGGEGTEANPYMIETANQLYYLATLGTEDTAGKFFKLANNIVISNVRTGWEKESPYAWAVKDINLEAEEYSNTFAGTLDGAGYTVSGIYFADFSYAHNNDAFGLLPSVSANAVIKNLTVSNAASSVTNSEYVGAVAGSVYLTPAEATNKLNKVHFVGVNLENSNLAVIGRGVTASKFDLCNADIFSAVNGANAVTRNCNADIAYTDDVIICNANTVNDGIKTTIRMILLGLDNSYVADVNGDGDFDICDLVATEDRYR